MATQVRGLSFWLLGGLLLFTPLFVSLQVHEPFTTPKVLFVQLMATLLLLLWASKTHREKRLSLPAHPLFLCFYAIFAWRLFTYTWALHSPSAANELYQQFSLLVITVAAYFLISRSLMKKVLLCAVCAGVITSSLAMLQYYKVDGAVLEFIKIEGLFDLTYLVNPVRPGSRPFLHGFDGNRNHLAGYLIGLVPLLVINLIKHKDNGLSVTNILTIACLLLFTAVLLLSYCRGAWLSLGLILFFYFVAIRKLKTMVGLFLSLFALVLAFGSPELHPSLALSSLVFGIWATLLTIRQHIGDKKVVFACLGSLVIAALVGLTLSNSNPLSMANYSIFQRLNKLLRFDDSGPLARRLETNISWHMATASPKTIIFGRGVGQYGVHYQIIQGALLEKKEFEPYLQKAGHTSRAHNEFFQRWCQEGAIGLLLALSTVFVLFKSLRRLENFWDDEFLLSIVFSILSINCHSLLSFAIHKPTLAVFNAILLGFFVRLLSDKEVHWEWKEGHGSYMLTVPLVLLAILLANQAMVKITAERHWVRALDYKRSGLNAKALILLHKASLLAPDDYQLLFDYGTSLLKAKLWNRALYYFKRAENARVIPEAAFNRAICHLQLGRLEEAERELRRAIYFKPDYVQAIAGLTQILAGQKRIDEAIAYTRRAMAADPYSVPLFHLYAKQHAQKGDYHRAHLILREALPMSDEPQTDLIMSFLLMSMKCYEKDDTLQAYNLLVKRFGLAALRQKLPSSALMFIDYFRVIDSGDSESIESLSLALTSGVEDRADQHMRNEAAMVIKEYLKRNSKAELARLTYAMLLNRSEIESDRREALEYLRLLIKELKDKDILEKAKGLLPQFEKGAH